MMTTKITASIRAAIAGLALAFLILPAAPLGGMVPIPNVGGEALADEEATYPGTDPFITPGAPNPNNDPGCDAYMGTCQSPGGMPYDEDTCATGFGLVVALVPGVKLATRIVSFIIGINVGQAVCG